MIITEEAINSNIVYLIGEMCIIDNIGNGDGDVVWNKYDLGYIMGMRDLGERLKEVLRA